MFDSELDYILRKRSDNTIRDHIEVEFTKGILSPPVKYLKAYAAAGEILWQRADNQDLVRDLSQPLLYLQRHTVELALKEHLKQIVELWRRQIRSFHLHGEGTEPRPIPARLIEDLCASHILGDLLSHIETALAHLQLETPLHPAFAEYIILVDTVEGGEPARFRYSTIRNSRSNLRSHSRQPKHLESSYPSSIKIPLGRLSRLVATIIESGCAVSDKIDPSRPLSLLDELVQTNVVLDQMELSEFDYLATRTDSGEIKWGNSTKPLGNSADPFLKNEYLMAVVDGRVMVILGRKDPDDEHKLDFAIALKTTSRSVEHLTWLDEWNYYIVGAALRSVRSDSR